MTPITHLILSIYNQDAIKLKIDDIASISSNEHSLLEVRMKDASLHVGYMLRPDIKY